MGMQRAKVASKHTDSLAQVRQNLNSHVCQRMLPSNLPTLHKLSQTTQPPIEHKLFHSFLVISLFFINSTPIQ